MTIQDFTHHELTLKATLKIRKATIEDVKHLEWNGQFTHFRKLFRRAYLEQRNGKRLMLVMDFNGYPIARLFIQFISTDGVIADGKSRGYIYSFTVMEHFRSLGIGTQMLAFAENILQKQGYRWATISVAKENTRALKLYKRQKYRIYGEDSGQWQYRDHEGKTHYVNEPSWFMKKSL
jgi:ribosomal protein S18 acetylase RimI-like enzyme